MLKQIVQQLKAERIHQKVTMEELSARSGVSTKHISNIENEKVRPSLEILEKLAKPLGVNIDVKLVMEKAC